MHELYIAAALELGRETHDSLLSQTKICSPSSIHSSTSQLEDDRVSVMLQAVMIRKR